LTYRIAVLAALLGASATFVTPTAAYPGGRNPPLPTPDLLVDLARDYGLRCHGEQTPADALHIRTLLRAALRLDPQQVQAQAWLYELATLSQQPDEAREMLSELVAADPANLTAFSNWLETGPPDVQTAEQYRTWLAGVLRGQERPENRALVHTQLARLALQRLDQATARQHLEEAARLWPECPDAIILELEFDANAEALERLAAVLRALRVNPLRVDFAWDAATLLDERGFAPQALPFYEHAVDLHRAANPGVALPHEWLLQLSRNAVARGELQEGVRYAQQAAEAEQNTFESRLYLYWLLEKRVPPATLERVRSLLAQQFAAIKEPSQWPVEVVAQAAWFYCTIDEQPQRALLLAENAARRAANDVFATRVLGWAQALNQQTEQAQKTLTPIARTDPYAAYRLAKLLREAGHEEAAAGVIAELAYVPPVGRARELLDELDLLGPATQPAVQRFPEMAQVLAQFDWQVLQLHKNPGHFLEAAITFDDPSLAPGEPWWAEFSLTNHGDFPITLGPQWMVNPVFLLSFHVEGDRQRDYPNVLTICLDHIRVIRPGQAVRIRRTIDVGPLRKLARRTPQHLQSVSVTAILDPVCTPDGRWQPGLAGQQLRAVSLVRLPANTSPEAWHARFSALRGWPTGPRFQALEVMAELLGEQQRARLKPLAYTPQPVPTDRVRQALHSALTSESWETRVRALDALQVAGLGRTLVNAAEQCLEHSHWLVRMMAVRLLARQGRAFAQTARRIAESDDDELVRALARSYVERWSSPPATAPTTQPQPGPESGGGGVPPMPPRGVFR
jgi:hypothetical protein